MQTMVAWRCTDWNWWCAMREDGQMLLLGALILAAGLLALSWLPPLLLDSPQGYDRAQEIALAQDAMDAWYGAELSPGAFQGLWTQFAYHRADFQPDGAPACESGVWSLAFLLDNEDIQARIPITVGTC